MVVKIVFLDVNDFDVATLGRLSGVTVVVIISLSSSQLAWQVAITRAKCQENIGQQRKIPQI